MIDLNNTAPQTQYNVLLIGDSCLDVYKIGLVTKISPEAPVPVMQLLNEYSLPGMASNVHKNLTNFNIQVDFVTNQESIVKTRFVDSRFGQQLLRVDTEPQLVPWSGKTPFPLSTYDAIVISDYNKGFLLDYHIKQICVDFTGPIFIDTKKSNLKMFGFDNVFVKINELEYRQLESIPKNLIVTLGDRGAMLKNNDEEMIYPTRNFNVVDVCGAGDTFLAALTMQYLFTKDIEKAIIFANIAAGITVQHRGNYAPTYDEIRIAGY
jgi:D-beta-D-heptose 7-phosphate kinase/D-beta-D-heptose 1-phosphate adenosyltransferase